MLNLLIILFEHFAFKHIAYFMDIIDFMAWEPNNPDLEKEFLTIALLFAIIAIILGAVVFFILKKKKTGKKENTADSKQDTYGV